eukprot:scaffold72814_cov20-Tisochrysis_lutea.AAC.2
MGGRSGPKTRTWEDGMYSGAGFLQGQTKNKVLSPLAGPQPLQQLVHLCVWYVLGDKVLATSKGKSPVGVCKKQRHMVLTDHRDVNIADCSI